MSVLELVESLGDTDDAYKRKVKKGVHHVDIFYVLALFIPMLIALRVNNRLKSFSPAPSPSDLIHSSYTLADLLGGEMPSIHLGRPGGVPVTIFNPTLVSIQRSLDNLKKVQVSCSDVDRAAKYLRILTVCLTFVKRNRTPVKELVDEVKVQNQADLSTLLYH